MLLQVEDFAGKPGKDVKEPGVFEWVLAEFLFQEVGGEVAQKIVILAGDDLEGGFRECGGVVISDHFEGGFTIGAEVIEVCLMGEVALVAFGVPAGKVHFVERIRERRVGGGLEYFGDAAIWQAVVEQVIDLIAEDFWEPGDFAMEPVFAFLGRRLRGRGLDDGEFGGCESGLGL